MRSFSIFIIVHVACCGWPNAARSEPPSLKDLVPRKSANAIRVATFNVSLNRSGPGKIELDLRSGKHPQCRAIATVIRAVQPDILVLNELDYSSDTDNARLFHDTYLADPEPDLLSNPSWSMPHHFSAEVNTGIPSGLDLNRNSKLDDPEDAWGFGRFPGQYGMAILSRFEIDSNLSRTFQKVLWSELPGALEPTFPDSGEKYYSPEVWSKLRLSSKSFWDVAVKVPGNVIHVLASHPTPPVFDGPEDRNGCRNHDEIRLLVEYINTQETLAANGKESDFWQDDLGHKGALAKNELFVIAGDLNCDPLDGDSRRESLLRLLEHPKIQSRPIPTSKGAVQAAVRQAGKNQSHRGESKFDTGDFNDEAVGNMRIDYVLPSSGFKVIQSGVFWPELPSEDSAQAAVLKRLSEASDHHLVWVDVGLPEAETNN